MKSMTIISITSALIALAMALIAIVLVIVNAGASSATQVRMPLVFYKGFYPAVTPSPTPTNTPKPPTPTEVPPTPTPTIIVAEGGNTCTAILGAGINKEGGTTIGALAPSVCSYLKIHHEQENGLVVIQAERIRTDTWGCQEDDFGPLVEWPPVDAPCPPEEPFFDEFGRILWGDYEGLKLENSYKVVCSFCEECGPPYTFNCFEVFRPNTQEEMDTYLETLESYDR